MSLFTFPFFIESSDKNERNNSDLLFNRQTRVWFDVLFSFFLHHDECVLYTHFFSDATFQWIASWCSFCGFKNKSGRKKRALLLNDIKNRLHAPGFHFLIELRTKLHINFMISPRTPRFNSSIAVVAHLFQGVFVVGTFLSLFWVHLIMLLVKKKEFHNSNFLKNLSPARQTDLD